MNMMDNSSETEIKSNVEVLFGLLVSIFTFSDIMTTKLIGGGKP
jgi:hypothetical protein